jgi:UDP-N-acetylmuramyl tripeptide synthase
VRDPTKRKKMSAWKVELQIYIIVEADCRSKDEMLREKKTARDKYIGRS